MAISITEYDNEIARLTAENHDLEQRLRHRDLTEQARFRRVDCLKIASERLAQTGKNNDDLVEFAARLATFAETGDTGGGQGAAQTPETAARPIPSHWRTRARRLLAEAQAALADDPGADTSKT